MKFTSNVLASFGAAASLATGAWAQSIVKEPNTGISFQYQPTSSDSAFGLALPADAATKDATEYIGYYVGSLDGKGVGYGGVSHGGGMPNALLLMLWPYQGKIMSSFRYAGGYVLPDVYHGTNAAFTPIWSHINDTTFEVVYRCTGCWSWNQDGATGNASTSSGYVLVGWAQAHSALTDPSNPATSMRQHDTQGLVVYQPALQPDGAASNDYASWAAKAPATGTGSGGNGTSSATPTPAPTASATPTATPITGSPAPTDKYDYIVVGAGAGGIPIADKLSESGASVLLIERGPPSSARWGGKTASNPAHWTPAWLAADNVTRFDVPGLDNEIWVDSAGIACADIDQMAGCVLGGGVAVNAGLWWKAPDVDWDYNFPTGWKSADTKAAANRVFQRIPGTDHPSMDGKLYLPEGYQLVGEALANHGYKNVTANDVPNEKNHTFSHPPFMYSHGERGGPMATYLVTANQRKNFKMILNTDVTRVIRTGGHITGVEVAAYANGGYSGVINVTATTGRVVLSAGTFGSARILLRSGIGPADQLAIVNGSTDGPTMISQNQWINLPVGHNLQDHQNTDLVIQHPSIKFYDYYEAYDTPNPTDADLYTKHRSGPLAQSAPNIAPLFWEELTGSDGIVRQLHWTCRAEGSRGAPNNFSMTLSQYLGRGYTSRGQASIQPNLHMTVSKLPYFQTKEDLAVATQGVKNLVDILKTIPDITLLYPTANQTAEDYMKAYPIERGRGSNHWIGSNKMGTDDGRKGGTAVVDTDTKVYGTDNLFVVDASIFPGMMTANPSGMIVTAAERASERILALKSVTTVGKWGQCWGAQWSQSSVCAAKTTCQHVRDTYWQCL